jgi:hypothetical protein
VSLDGVYDYRANRRAIFNRNMHPNIPENLRGCKTPKRGRKRHFDAAIFLSLLAGSHNHATANQARNPQAVDCVGRYTTEQFLSERGLSISLQHKQIATLPTTTKYW